MKPDVIRTERRRTRLSHVDETALGRGSQLVDLFTARDRQRHGVGELLDEQICRQGLFAMECAIETSDHGLLDFRAAESFAGVHDLREVELCAVLLSKAQVDRPDGGPFVVVRQVHEENFIKPAFAQQLRRERGKVIRCGYDEDVLLFLLQPGEEGAEEPSAQAPVRLSAASSCGHGFFNFIDPEHDRGQGFCHLDGFAKVLFGLADEFVE